MTTDPLAPLLALADITAAVEQARARFDQALGHRALRRHGGQVAAEVSLRSAVASAALEGARHEREAVRAGTVTDPVLQGALRVAGALPGLSELWPKAPRQALAKLHVLAARDLVSEAELGRPVADPVVATRLDGLAGLVAGGTKVSPLVLAAVVHGELLNLRPFAGPSGVVARGAARLVLLASGLDPRGLLPVDVGHREREPEYVGAAGAFATGTPDGLRSWLRHYMAAVEVGTDQLTAIGDEILAAA